MPMDTRLAIAQAKYREAWNEYINCTDLLRRKQLERTMDRAQGDFEHDEFFEFLKELK